MQKKYKRLLLSLCLIIALVLLGRLLTVAFSGAAVSAGPHCGVPWLEQFIRIFLATLITLSALSALILRLQPVRRILAAVFFIGLTLLFVDFTGTAAQWFGGIAKLQLLPALLAVNVGVVLVLLLLTLAFGRIYCSIVCPLGIMQDLIARIGRIGRRRPYSYSKEKRVLRYGFLVLFLILLVAGIGSAAALIAPYSSFGRIAQNLLQPVWILGNNLLAAFSEHLDNYAFYHTDLWLRSLSTFLIALATFIFIAILAWRNGRTYCNTVCPVGTFLGFFSRFSWLKIHFDAESCHNCGKCSSHCKAACLDFKTHTVDYSRCVVCGNCLEQCSFSALTYGHIKHGKAVTPKPAPTPATDANQQSTTSEIDSSRRTFLVAAAMATTTAAMAQKDKKVDGGLATIEKKVAPHRITPLTPPGSWSARHFAQHCTACQLCVAECPNGVLRPSTDLLHLMQPTMSYERGYCRPECNRCSQVCPTGAIRPITLEEKSSAQIGHAIWIKRNCVVVTDHVNCGNCARNCPSGAITMVPLVKDDPNSPLVPAVNEARCIGCGACEYVCPSRPFSAIHVEGHEEHRTI